LGHKQSPPPKFKYSKIYIQVYKRKMKKKTIKTLRYISWVIGAIAAILLIYGIIRTLIV